MDNDLSPLLARPKLVELRMRDRRGYQPPVAEVKALIYARA